MAPTPAPGSWCGRSFRVVHVQQLDPDTDDVWQIWEPHGTPSRPQAAEVFWHGLVDRQEDPVTSSMLLARVISQPECYRLLYQVDGGIDPHCHIRFNTCTSQWVTWQAKHGSRRLTMPMHAVLKTIAYARHYEAGAWTYPSADHSEDGRLLSRPGEGDQEWDVRLIRGHRRCGRGYQYLTRWMDWEEGRNAADWVNEATLKDGAVLREYKQKHGLS